MTMEKRKETGARKRRGYALLVALAMMVLIFVVSAGVAIFLRAQFDVIASRTARLRWAVLEVTEVLVRQLVIYSSGVNEYYRALEDKSRSDGEREELKSVALARWFSREELEARNGSGYAYEEVREKFGPTKFGAADDVLNSSLLRIAKFELSIPGEDAVYDLGGFLVAGRLIIEIEMEEGALLGLFSKGNKRYGKGVGTRLTVTEMWDKGGVVVTIPIKIEGDGKNFWTN
ncbi:MAG: hypothetical protein LBS00_04875 [Synergistaceae bacterium]|jgi:hypothetical protein|nr:hypothetical protein [Synergistaceae bacterium]